MSIVYVRVRALGMASLLLGNALQAALLGAKDSMSPLRALTISSVFNAVGDFALVYWLKQGVFGAAAATALAQFAGLLLLFKAARVKGLLETGKSSNTTNKEDDLQPQFLSFAPPVLLVVIGKMACFGFMTHVAATLGAASLAAHQVVLSMFFFLSPFTEVASQTAQVFLPAFEENRSKSAQWAAVTGRLVRRLQSLAVFSGVAVGAIGAVVPLCLGTLFTRDLAVLEALKPLALLLFASVGLHGFICSAEGVLLVRRELGFLGKIYATSAVLMPAWLLHLKRTGASLPAVWSAFVVFQLVRAVVLTWRVERPFAPSRPLATA